MSKYWFPPQLETQVPVGPFNKKGEMLLGSIRNKYASPTNFAEATLPRKSNVDAGTGGGVVGTGSAGKGHVWVSHFVPSCS